MAQHVYLVPDTYIGSDKKTERQVWLHDFDTNEPKIELITLPQGVERVFLEILSNAGDQCLRSMKENIKPGTVAVTMTTTTISVRNEGKSFPVKINKTHNLWNPELAFGQLLTSTNYETDKKRVGCGRNGIGAKATNIFSSSFRVKIGDSQNKILYDQTWTHNMRERTEPKITKYMGSAFVEIIYTLDFPRFGYSEYPEEAFGLFARYVYDYSQNIHVTTSFNGLVFQASDDPRDHARFYFGQDEMFLHYEWPSGTEVKNRRSGVQVPVDPMTLPTSTLVLVNTPGEGKCVSFVNGMMTLEGGVHVDEAYKAISKPLLELMNSQTKSNERKTKLTWRDIRTHLSLLLVCHLDDPQFGGQMKEKLTSPKPAFKITERALSVLESWSFVAHLQGLLNLKINKLLASTDGKKRMNIKEEKGVDCNYSGGPKSAECLLFVVEGDSAKNYAYEAQGIIKGGVDYVGIFPIKGKPINAMKLKDKPLKLKDNEEIKGLKTYLGLEEFTDYSDPKNFKRLRYGQMVILADADDDGKHIVGLLLLFFHCFYPSLLARGYVSMLRTPLIRITSSRHDLVFYTDAEYKLWANQTPNHSSYGAPKYFKGLGSSTPKDVRHDFKDPHYVKCKYSTKDVEMLDLAFNAKRADDRKLWLCNWHHTLEELNIGRIKTLTVSEIIEKEVVPYFISSIRRCIPSFMDGLKEIQRKILWGAWLIWGKNNTKIKKVPSLSAYIVDHLGYHHGETCLEKAIISMAQRFVGSNNMNYLYPDGMFGSRMEGGKDACAGRYLFTKLEWWVPYVFKVEDLPLLTYMEDNGTPIEPQFLLPILPMHLINGAHGIGTGYSTHIPNYHPLDIIGWLMAKLSGGELPKINPCYIGFKGKTNIVIKGETSGELVSEDELEPKRGQISLMTTGCFESRLDHVIVKELPVGVWTLTYRNWLNKLLAEKQIKKYTRHGDVGNVMFKIYGLKNATTKNLKLTKSYGMSNMVLLDTEDRPKKYHTITAILEEFYHSRLPYFEARKKCVIASYEDKIARLDAKARFIKAIKTKAVDINASNEEIDARLAELNIPSYVRDIKTRTLAKQNADKLMEEINKLEASKLEYSKKTPESLWCDDLEEFQARWSEKEGCHI